MNAVFSECRKYRYTLWRTVDGGLFPDTWTKYVNFICLNPSTADEVKDDPTIRKCVRLARNWGYEAICVTNLFAYRATDPKVMKSQSDPIGSMNDVFIQRVAFGADLVIAAWGQHGAFLDRSTKVRQCFFERPKILRMGKTEPWHPLYLPDNSKPIEWNSFGDLCLENQKTITA